MLDKFTIGPVTIVQLVGLTAKPRIASAQADGAVRAADPIPPSAAAGLGDGLSKPVGEIENSSLGLKAAPSLGLSADPMHAHISLESGADRPVAGVDAPSSAIDPSAFDHFLPDGSQVAPVVPGRDTLPPTPDASPVPDMVPAAPATGSDIETAASPTAPSDGSIPGTDPGLGYIFDGVESFGDDQILDFTTAVGLTTFTPTETALIMSSSDISVMLAVTGLDEYSAFAAVDFSGVISHDLVTATHGYTESQHIPSATDAIPSF